MTNLEKGNRVIASAELLSEIEALEIHGGNMGGVYNSEGDVQHFCYGANCVANCGTKCSCPDDGPKTAAQCTITQYYCSNKMNHA